MPYCQKCGAEFDKGAKFCPTCGTTVGPLVVERRRMRRVQRRPLSTLTIAKIVLLVVVVVVATVIAIISFGFWQPFGRVVGSGNLATEEKGFTDFTIVNVGWGFEVEINQSESYNISITADDNLLDYIEVSKTGNALTIGLKWGYGYQDVTLRADITMPDLYELKFSGGTHGTAKGFTSSHEYVLSLSGGSTIILDGAASDLIIGASGGSHLYLSEFFVHNANVNLSGGSEATIALDGRLDADLSGGSLLLYIGNPTMGDIHISGGSRLKNVSH